MNTDVSKGLEKALRAAASGAEGGVPSDWPTLLMQALPKVLEHSSVNEELVELLKEGLLDLRKQLDFLRRQQSELVRSHKGVLKKLSHLHAQQNDIARHLNSVPLIRLIDPQDEAELDEELEEMLYPEPDLDFPAVAPSEAEGQGPRRTSRRSQNPRPRRS